MSDKLFYTVAKFENKNIIFLIREIDWINGTVYFMPFNMMNVLLNLEPKGYNVDSGNCIEVLNFDQTKFESDCQSLGLDVERKDDIYDKKYYYAINVADSTISITSKKWFDKHGSLDTDSIITEYISNYGLVEAYESTYEIYDDFDEKDFKRYFAKFGFEMIENKKVGMENTQEDDDYNY